MKHPRRSIPLLCLAILLGAVALGALAHTSTSASSSRLSQAADDVHTLHQLLGSAQVDAILSGQRPTALEDLDTSQLEALFNALGDEESYSLEESEQAGAIQAKIAAILNLRTQDLPSETTPVTLDRLLALRRTGSPPVGCSYPFPLWTPLNWTRMPPFRPRRRPTRRSRLSWTVCSPSRSASNRKPPKKTPTTSGASCGMTFSRNHNLPLQAPEA